MVVKSGDTVGVVEALDIVARWCVVAAPLGLFLVGRSCIGTFGIPVNMVHDMKA